VLWGAPSAVVASAHSRRGCWLPRLRSWFLRQLLVGLCGGGHARRLPVCATLACATGLAPSPARRASSSPPPALLSWPPPLSLSSSSSSSWRGDVGVGGGVGVGCWVGLCCCCCVVVFCLLLVCGSPRGAPRGARCGYPCLSHPPAWVGAWVATLRVGAGRGNPRCRDAHGTCIGQVCRRDVTRLRCSCLGCVGAGF
jgi:hypothetical protein